MNKFDLSGLGSITLSSLQGAQYIPLGKTDPREMEFEPLSMDKIKGKTRKTVETVWGTLGMADDSQLEISGTLSYSKRGNLTSLPNESGIATTNEIINIVLANFSVRDMRYFIYYDS